MMRTEGKMQVIYFSRESDTPGATHKAVVEVVDCRNIDDDGKVLSEHDIAYYTVYCASKNEALALIADGRGEYLGDSWEITMKVENGGFYDTNSEGTWHELVEEMALKLEGWNTYDVERTSNMSGVRHYWGVLDDEKGQSVFSFYAWFDANEGEVEVTRIIPENE